MTIEIGANLSCLIKVIIVSALIAFIAFEATSVYIVSNRRKKDENA